MFSRKAGSRLFHIAGPLSSRNVCWSRRMLPPGESRRVCAERYIKIRKKTGQTDGRTDSRQLHYAFR